MNKQILKEFEENINRDDLIVMFSDFDCPWCYFSLGLMQEIKGKTGISVKRYPFQILPDVDTKGGLTVEAYDKMRGNTPQKRIENNKGIVSFAEQWDLPYVQRDRFFQSRPALTFNMAKKKILPIQLSSKVFAMIMDSTSMLRKFCKTPFINKNLMITSNWPTRPA
ncbi:MAG: hypothetical protein B6D64_13075 [Bacteroidetes bacterium 4484_276]|nr:MAG: hypothetical protein B6D64_13075 [Bacteroidetes bacterium 4484_276]